MFRNKTENGLAIGGGCALMAVGIQCFLEPAKIVAGGITGVGIILDTYTRERFGVGTPLWLMNVLFNFPLFLLAWKMEGGVYAGKTFLTSLLFSVMLFFAQGISFFTGDLILAAVYGGALVGAGLGLVLKCGATTGGVDLAAALFHRFWRRPSLSGKIFLMDATIILAGMLTFGGMNGLYAIFAVFITERCIVWVLEGTEVIRGAIVISKETERIAEVLEERLGRKIGSFTGQGQRMGEDNNMLFCVFSQKEIQAVKSIIIQIDRNAFFFVMDIREVLGYHPKIK